MCHAVPMRIVSLQDNDMATVEIGGVRKTASMMLIEDARIGDYVVVHTGFALSKLDPKEAQATLELFAEIEPSAVGPGE